MFRLVTRPWSRYAAAVAAAILGAILAVPVQHWAGGRVPFLTFFPLVTVVAVAAGLGLGGRVWRAAGSRAWRSCGGRAGRGSVSGAAAQDIACEVVLTS